ncbi:GNAT family N-acetyltransferase [Pseudohoeflea coraliihabitans]|uniref:1-acyl-sn-glycerol-3-phosphate acyltransferase n=1 Tax=Pseudohoeflea coraliihabitans TaxID=2860393 RepID=A0ABS6WNT9_9HYPH|nr:1-acyl-sn-glycerol-3-phosphate acyltransferase [Pseudohoeflea sp. DP4N28-3]MBW3096765.1 1-acyl-sn-glycerol-3-phosphate acyltransferase [Pseudohoeflea sp. DP4N28-3]
MTGRRSTFTETLTQISFGNPGHIVDQLIAERGEKLVQSPAWPLLRPALYSFFHYRQAIALADEIAGKSGFEAFAHLSALLDLDVQVRHAERIPRQGGFLMVPNHPTGIADGVAVFDLLKSIRPDMMFFANRDAIRVNPRFSEMIIPVEWRPEYKSRSKARETLVLTNRAVAEGKATVLFPSGRIAYWNEGRLTERPWKLSAVTLARKHNLTVLPVHVVSRNSGLFYWLAKHSTELRDMTVFHELLNKKRQTFSFTIGHPIAPEDLDGDPNEVTKALEDHTVRHMASDPHIRFQPREPLAAAAE